MEGEPGLGIESRAHGVVCVAGGVLEGRWTQRQRVVGRTPAPGDLLGLNNLSCKRGYDAPFRMAVIHRETTDLSIQTCLVYTQNWGNRPLQCKKLR